MSGSVFLRLGVMLLVTGWWGGSAYAASVSGEVQVEGRKRVGKLVVYLERPAATTGKPSTEPVRISQRGRTFSPGTVVIVQDSEVAFVNDEERDIDHNVYSLSRGSRFDVGLQPRGSVRKVRFSTPGIVKYFCSVHKKMQGTIVVVPNPYFVVLKRPGKFTFADVPSGDWLVRVLVGHRRYRSEPVPVRVASASMDNVVVQLTRKR